MKKLCLFLVVGLALISAGCSGERTFKQVRILMGTPVEITVVAKDRGNAHQAIDLAFAEIKRIEQLMTSYDPQSALSRLNRRAGEEFVKADKEIFHLIIESIRLSKLSKGAFDITVAPLVEAYGFNRREGNFTPLDRTKNKSYLTGFTLPSKEKITELLKLVGSDKIIIDAENNKVKFSISGMKLDLGGIAKGYAVDRAVGILKQKGIDSALVNLGGNIFALGTSTLKGASRSWRIGIQDPEIKDRIWATIELNNEAAATSGNYERFFTAQGKSYGHIIDPRTGRPVGTVLSVTVIASSALKADGFSTAVFVLGARQGMELIESVEDIEGVIITKDGENIPQKQFVSKGLKRRLLRGQKIYSRLW